MKQSELRQLIREEIRKIISESSKNKNRKHTFESFSSIANEALRMVGGDKILSKMKIVDDHGNWDLNILELKDDDDEEYYVVTGKYATSAISGDTIWIRKTQWAEFKKMINSI